jgi:outer membrane protein OmpA-like peptidoglycan-associated protein
MLSSGNADLDKIAIAIMATPDSRWEVGGYTDNRGMPAANLRLSQARAQAVMQYLVSKNVPAGSLTAVGYGNQRPAVPNTTPAGRAQNRRVELKRIQ